MLQALDTAVFRFINSSLSNPLFDGVMPYFSDLPYFVPILAVVLITIAVKGGTRGRIFLALLLLAIFIGDGWICNTIKHALQRPRPFAALADVHLLVGKGGSGSMPSSHAANWFAATMVTFIFYRRSWRFMLPLALLVSFSRVYNGVHYPSDVLAGAILGAGYATALVFGADWLWTSIGRRWFPLWWQKLPSLLNANAEKKEPLHSSSDLDTHWLRLGYVLIFLLFVLRLFYINSSIIELTEDEAYQWTWSKNLALSYYSKPPLIALVQFLGTHLWGDREFGVRFFSPVISAMFSLLLLRFFRRQVSGRAAFTITLILTATLLLAVGSTLMTIDPLSVLFWMATMLAGWRAIQPESTTRDWLWVGLWMGLGFLSKYTNLFQWISWILFFVLYPPARKQLRTPGPYLALFINALCLLPVLIWNAQHDWITFEHVANDGAIGKGWSPKVHEFIAAELFLLNPIFFCAMIVASVAFWRKQRNALTLFLFAMGAPLFLFYFVFSFHSRVLPNWIAPSIIPLLCLMALYWRTHWANRTVRILFAVAIVFGIILNVIGHDTNLVAKILKRSLPAKIDPLRRARAWSGTGNKIAEVRRTLAREGTPTFIICSHYGITGELSFYVPEAKPLVGTDKPLVYFLAKDHPENQYYFWPTYLSRKGENAIFVQTVEEPKLVEGWFLKWLKGGANLIRPNLPKPLPAPTLLQKQFSTVKDLGIFKIEYRGQIFRHIQLFECRDLKTPQSTTVATPQS